MQINVSELLKAHVGTTQDYELSETFAANGDSSENSVQGKVNLLRTNRGILVNGKLHAETKLTCSRCLSLYPYHMELNLEEEYIPTVDMASGSPLPSSGETNSFTVDEHQVIDLTEAVRQDMLLAIPIKPLCREDCAGLCQNCGHNLNLEPCGCPSEPIDPRWSKLNKLIQNQA